MMKEVRKVNLHAKRSHQKQRKAIQKRVPRQFRNHLLERGKVQNSWMIQAAVMKVNKIKGFA
jgi:hypothetical protein